MKPYFEQHGITLHHGDCRDVLAALPENSVDTVITDPPYELGFMGKAWDRSGVAFQPQTWAAVLRVAKPGAFLLAFGGTRTFHRLTCAIEDGGWEVRDCLSWLYGSGFPKSLDISKAMDKAAGAEREVVADRFYSDGRKRPNGRSTDGSNEGWKRPAHKHYKGDRIVTAPAIDAAKLWNGWGTALKPAWEPIIVAMKPLDGTFAQNAERWGVAGLNVDGGRLTTGAVPTSNHNKTIGGNGKYRGGVAMQTGGASGRWPANVMLDEAAAGMLDETTGERGGGFGVSGGDPNGKGIYGKGFPRGDMSVVGYGDVGGPSRFFYTSKASRSDRGAGNDHPTVKPTDLLKYLCKLTDTPTSGVVLDPFAGSGTTLVAAREYGRPAIGIELEESHCRIVSKRLAQGVLFGVSE